MDINEKKAIYKTLSKTQKKELKDLLKYFNSSLWLVEPTKVLYGVKWSHTDLRRIVNKL